MKPSQKYPKNRNHPKIGAQIKVEPIKTRKDIETIKNLLSGKPRDLALFVLGINTNLRASDLCRIKAGDVSFLKEDEDFEFTEKKTGKKRRVTLNIACIEVIQTLLASDEFTDDDQLFKGKRGDITPITVHYLVNQWTSKINLRGNYGSHSLRKTWGYMQRTVFKEDIPVLMAVFGHATQKQTLEYLCIQPEEIRAIYKNVL